MKAFWCLRDKEQGDLHQGVENQSKPAQDRGYLSGNLQGAGEGGVFAKKLYKMFVFYGVYRIVCLQVWVAAEL